MLEQTNPKVTETPQGVPSDEPFVSAVREELGHVLASRCFQSAEGQRNFLRYVVEETLNGRGDALKEYPVAVEVFRRGERFDPRLDSIVRTEARKLRARLAKYYEAEGCTNPIRIELPKGGYAPVFRANAPRAETLETPLEPPGARSKSSHPRYWRIAGTVAGVLLVAAGALYLISNRRQPESPSGPPSIAVLPFLNVANDRDDSFSDGLTEEIIDSLARNPELRVVARASAFQYKGKTLDIRTIGRELGVRTILEGSVRRYGSRLRVIAELDDASSGYQLWASSYDRDLKDALIVQREISQAINRALGFALTRGNQPSGPGLDSVALNPGAYQDYLRGLSYWNRQTAEDARSAIALFQQAIAQDPNYALAYLGLAHAYSAIPVFSATSSSEAIPQIRAAASKALELDPTLGEAHIDLALADLFDDEWQTAEMEFQKGLALSPGDAYARTWYGNYLQRAGRLEEALQQHQLAWKLDPLSSRAAVGVARTLYHMHRFKESIAQYQKALTLNQNSGVGRQGLGLAYLQAGQTAEGVAETELASKLMGGDSMITGQLGYAYARAGNSGRATSILNQLLQRSNLGAVRALPIAQIYIGLGEKEKGFDWLAKAIDQKDASLSLKTDPFYDPLRSDPRFGELLKRIRLQ